MTYFSKDYLLLKQWAGRSCRSYSSCQDVAGWQCGAARLIRLWHTTEKMRSWLNVWKKGQSEMRKCLHSSLQRVATAKDRIGRRSRQTGLVSAALNTTEEHPAGLGNRVGRKGMWRCGRSMVSKVYFYIFIFYYHYSLSSLSLSISPLTPYFMDVSTCLSPVLRLSLFAVSHPFSLFFNSSPPSVSAFLLLLSAAFLSYDVFSIQGLSLLHHRPVCFTELQRGGKKDAIPQGRNKISIYAFSPRSAMRPRGCAAACICVLQMPKSHIFA